MKKLFVSLAAILVAHFLIAWFFILAWNGFAQGFNLPTFGYWHWFVTSLAVRGVFGKMTVKTNEDE